MISKPAQYILRFDDLCPTVSYSRWQQFLPLIEKFKLQPILAVVPDNQDCHLQASPPDPDFWIQMRQMELGGAMIALHGYNHRCESRGPSLLGLHHGSEFAGVDESTQREWIHEGLAILRGHGLNPRIWVAPRHGFDLNTLSALRKEGIGLLSDGFARVPFTRGGLTWIPQQLSAPVEKSRGLWTICIHPNTAHSSLLNRLPIFLRKHEAQFTSVDRVLDEYSPAELGGMERLYEKFALWRAQASHVRRRKRSRHSHSG